MSFENFCGFFPRGGGLEAWESPPWEERVKGKRGKKREKREGWLIED